MPTDDPHTPIRVQYMVGSKEESGEQCTVVFAIIVTEPLSECVYTVYACVEGGGGPGDESLLWGPPPPPPPQGSKKRKA
jgi:hypothetical protein